MEVKETVLLLKGGVVARVRVDVVVSLFEARLVRLVEVKLVRLVEVNVWPIVCIVRLPAAAPLVEVMSSGQGSLVVDVW